MGGFLSCLLPSSLSRICFKGKTFFPQGLNISMLIHSISQSQILRLKWELKNLAPADLPSWIFLTALQYILMRVYAPITMVSGIDVHNQRHYLLLQNWKRHCGTNYTSLIWKISFLMSVLTILKVKYPLLQFYF